MTIFRSVSLICALAVLSASPAFAQTTKPSLLAYGSSDHYWIATIESYREGNKNLIRTQVRNQSLPAGDWKDIGPVLGQAIALAESQDELALLLDDGSWKRLGQAGVITGNAIPGSGPVLAWGSSAFTLYAIRAVEGGAEAVKGSAENTPADRDSATQPTTTRPTTNATSKPAPTTAATISAARPAVPVLLRFEKGEWRGLADLPAAAGSTALAIAGVNNKLFLASDLAVGKIRAWTLNDSKWEEWGEIKMSVRPTVLGALALSHIPAIWAMDNDGRISAFVKRENEDWSSLKNFKVPDSVQPGTPRTLASAGEEIRLIVQPKDGKLSEQRYDTTGAPRGELASLPVPQIYHENPLFRVMQLVVLLAMVIVMLVTFYKRRAAAAKDEEQ